MKEVGPCARATIGSTPQLLTTSAEHTYARNVDEDEDEDERNGDIGDDERNSDGDDVN